jgi:hypothetical protein
MSFGNCNEIRYRADPLREWVVFYAGSKFWMKPVCESVSPLRTVYLIRNHSNTVRPFEIVFFCPAHGAALARSKRSTRDRRDLASFLAGHLFTLLLSFFFHDFRSRGHQRVNLFLEIHWIDYTRDHFCDVSVFANNDGSR